MSSRDWWSTRLLDLMGHNLVLKVCVFDPATGIVIDVMSSTLRLVARL